MSLYLQQLLTNVTEPPFEFSTSYWEILLPSIWAAADIVSGFICAQINGTKNSSVMRKGLYRKVGEIMTVGLCWIFCLAVRCPYDLAACVAGYIVLMESLSIAENLKHSGVPIPDFITKKAKEAADAVNEGENNDAGSKDIH